MEKQYMDNSMHNQVKNIVGSAYKYENNICDRTEYISKNLKESFPSINWCVIIFDKNHGYFDFSGATTSYYFRNVIDGLYNIVIGFKE